MRIRSGTFSRIVRPVIHSTRPDGCEVTRANNVNRFVTIAKQHRILEGALYVAFNLRCTTHSICSFSQGIHPNSSTSAHCEDPICGRVTDAALVPTTTWNGSYCSSLLTLTPCIVVICIRNGSS